MGILNEGTIKRLEQAVNVLNGTDTEHLKTNALFDEIYSIDILIGFKNKFPDSIPESLRPDIDKLLKIYDLNMSYAANKTSANLTNLHNKINELVK